MPRSPYDQFRTEPLGDDDDPEEQARDRLRDRLVSGAGVLELPEPTMLVDGIFTTPSTATFVGPPKVGKSVAAIGLACSVATGSDWLGRKVVRGRVLYIAAEGVGGLAARVDAWLSHHNCEPSQLEPLTWLTCAVNLTEWADVFAVAAIVRELLPSLVIVDTLARCIVGADENTSRDMGQVVAALDYLRDVCGSCVVAVHHMGKDRSGPRGSTALPGAVDTSVEMEGDATSIMLRVAAQKDLPLLEPMWLRLAQVERSVVLTPVGPTADDKVLAALPTLEALRSVAMDNGATTTEWETAAAAASVSHGSFYRHRKVLVEAGVVENVGSDKRPRYRPVGAWDQTTSEDA